MCLLINTRSSFHMCLAPTTTIIDSANHAYVMTRMRRKFLQDTTVTILLVGRCTLSRRYVDWKLKSSLQQGETLPNGVMGIILPSQGTSAYVPPRLQLDEGTH